MYAIRSYYEPYDWAVRFEDKVRDLLNEGNDSPLISYETLGP